MTWQVRELRKATTDKRLIFRWIYKRSPSGAAARLSAYDETVDRLKANAATFAEAEENPDLELDVKQALFKTRRGRIYRVLFLIQAGEVYILRVRGTGQAPVEADDLD